jgi:hypothetical protein
MSNTALINIDLLHGASIPIDHDDRKLATRVSSDCLGVLRTGGEFRLIAVKKIAAGTRLFSFIGDITQRPTRYSVQIDDDRHIDLVGENSLEEILDRYYWRFTNHSCDPNTKIVGRQLVATHDIEPWRDVTFNYNTTEYDMAEPFECHCKSANCAGMIRGFKYLSPEQREQLRPLLVPYLLRYLPSEE